MPAGGERSTTSQHYACGNSGAIDLNYPPGIEASVIDEVRPHVIKLGFHTLWQVENHFDHMHIDASNLASPAPGSGLLGAAGSLTDSFLQVKLIDWDAPSAIGLGALFVGGAGGIRSAAGPAGRQRDVPGARPHERVAEGAPRGVGDGDRRVGREVARLGRPRLRGPLPAAPVPRLGLSGAGS